MFLTFRPSFRLPLGKIFSKESTPKLLPSYDFFPWLTTKISNDAAERGRDRGYQILGGVIHLESLIGFHMKPIPSLFYYRTMGKARYRGGKLCETHFLFYCIKDCLSACRVMYPTQISLLQDWPCRWFTVRSKCLCTGPISRESAFEAMQCIMDEIHLSQD